MKLTRFLVIPVVLLALSALSAYCASSEPLYRSDENTSAPLRGEVTEPRKDKSSSEVDEKAALELQASQAEKVRKSEEDYQSVLTGVARVVSSLEKRLTDLRRQVSPPMRADIDRLDQDLALVEKELSHLTISATSALVQLQRSDLQDRVFELTLSLEIMKRRWGASWKVFGLDFFNNVRPAEPLSHGPVPTGYRIRVGDTLRIVVVSELGAQKEYHPTVDSAGRAYVPGAGNVMAVGRTAAQLRDYLTDQIRSKFKQLQVAVSIEKLQTIRVQVAGEVARPGTYTITGMATLFDALYQAGGPTKSGTFRKMSLVRDGDERRTVDLYDFLMNGSKKHDVPLQEGDLVFVPPVGGTIVVDGEVIRAGRYEPDFPITLKQALDMAGGPKPGGYLQAVQVERVQNGEYRVLLHEPLNGDASKSAMELTPGDQVTVFSIRPDNTNKVEVGGPVGTPGVFGFKDGMRVKEIIALAQGLARDKEVYGGRADILRIDPLKGTEIIAFDLAKALEGDPEQNIELRKLDRVFVYEPEQVVFRPRLVTVFGPVAKPGTYVRTDGMSVRDVIAAAGGVMPDAYLTRADLTRHVSDGDTELVRVNLQSALNGDPGSNIRLQDRDVLTLYNLRDVKWSDKTVRVEGAVQRPGVYKRSDNMRVSDLVFASGGLLPEAGKNAEVAHSSGSSETSIVTIDLEKLVPCSEQDIVLRDRDIVTVPSVNPSLRAPEIVYLTGEVAKPGPYTLNSQNERLTDLIARAGGLTPYADTRGMLFLRQKESFENSQQGTDADIILKKCRAFADKQFLTQLGTLGIALPEQFIKTLQQSEEGLAKPAEVVEEEKLTKDIYTSGSSSDSDEENGGKKGLVVPGNGKTSGVKPTVKGRSTVNDGTKGPNERAGTTVPKDIDAPEKLQMSAMGPRMTPSAEEVLMSGFHGRQELAELAKSTRVSVDLNRAFQDSNSPDNIPMRQGDRVFVPRITNVVTVIGAVLHPHAFAAGSGKNADFYIERSGGFAQDAAKGNVVVVRSNGDALPRERVRSVEPGDMIVVPTTGLIDIAKKWERLGSVTKVISDILSSAFVLTRF